MNRFQYFSVLLGLVASIPLQARDYIGDAPRRTTPPPTTSGSLRSNCIESRAETDLNINNVRARMRAGGDMWWDNRIARYIVPNVDPASGQPEVSSLFAGSIWLGALDDGNNLIQAAQTYRSRGNDFWTGPLDPLTGVVDRTTCERWDRHFTVFGADIDALRADYLEPDPATGASDFRVDRRPSRGLLGWPGRGNPHFAEIYGFELPDQDLAPFIEPPGREDGIYDPYQGDHPVIEVVGCSNGYFNPVYADQMIWWVFNDRGNLHTQTNALPMSMEVQVTAFGYRTTDAINNMTFYRYKLLNRNTLRLKDTYFSVWTDPDLGCFLDDYIGVDTITGMGYVYNADNLDDPNCGGNNAVGYGSTVPALGVDYFRGPLDSAGNQIGLSSFQYYLNGTCPTCDPTSGAGYYNLQRGFWPDGVPITRGGNGRNPGSTDRINFVFPSWPNDNNAGAWSMCFGGNVGGGDYRFLHTSGPFVLLPGATNELIHGVVWVPELPDYPCPSMRELVAADVLAQNLFDDCFKITDGPDAPFIDVIELENELILNLSYVPSQNNFELKYQESPAILRGFGDTSYRFQGYKIYQVNSPNISVTDLEDLSKSRLIFQVDLQDSISKIVNWSVFDDPDVQAFVPKIMVDGENKGIKHTFRITEDQFASVVPRLVNHQPYYFCVVAYGFNEYQRYDPSSNTGQATPYLQGRRNFRVYTGIPRPNAPEFGGLVLNSAYGDGPEITRIDGRGNGGGLFLDFADPKATEDAILAEGRLGRVTYAKGQGPVKVQVVDPLRVPAGTFQLYLSDYQYGWQLDSATGVLTPQPPANATRLSDTLIQWVLKDVNSPSDFWRSYQPLTVNYEQYIHELGISLEVQYIDNPGTNGVSGFVGAEVVYPSTVDSPWYAPVLDQSSGAFNMLKTGVSQDDARFDPNEDYSKSPVGWYPVMLSDCRTAGREPYFSFNMQDESSCDIMRTSFANRTLSRQRNVNVVMTPDKSKWSRCIVLESGSPFYSGILGTTTPPSGTAQLDWKRNAPSRDKDGNIETGSTGFSWFPGYAYDVETGQRLNVVFAENSYYNGQIFTPDLFPGANTGDDMIYNPTDLELATPPSGFVFGDNNRYLSSVMGGQHIVYVANSEYDECQVIVNEYNRNPVPGFPRPYRLFSNNFFIWASMGYMAPGTSMRDGSGNPDLRGNVPPSEVTFKLRVATAYNIYRATNTNGGFPLYEFKLDEFKPSKQNAEAAKTALDLLNVVPNPYYAFSDYENTEADNIIKITNVPPQCDIRIYSLDGRFIREYKVAQEYPTQIRNGQARLGAFGSPNVEDQILTSVEWDLKNFSAVPVASGVYLIHVVVPGVGERVLKSFIINRAFDAQRL